MPTYLDSARTKNFCKLHNSRMCSLTKATLNATTQALGRCMELSIYRNAPLTNPDGDMDGALEQMSSFADEAARTSADEELYSSSLTGQTGAHLLTTGQDKPATPPKVI